MTKLRTRFLTALAIGLAPLAFWACSASDENTAAGTGASTGGSGGATAAPAGGAAGASGAGAGGATGTSGATGNGGGPANGGSTGLGGASGGTTGAGGSAGSSGFSGPDATTGSGGAGGGASAPDAGDACPAPPAGSPAAAVTALNTANTVRLKMGVPCLILVPELDISAQKHCEYYTANKGTETCIANAHAEVEGCTGFVAASFSNREKAAGYTGQPTSEVMAFRNNPASAVQNWIDTVYHRTPILSPWIRDMGYGGTTGCDTIDFGRGPVTANTVTAIYPYAGQAGVPLSFDGSREGPTPPVPPGGWPSGYPVHLYAKTLTVASHVFTVDGSATPISHTWIAESSDFILYADTPLTSHTTYRVQIVGTRAAETLTFDWTFTTK
jgi:hypothetical protein